MNDHEDFYWNEALILSYLRDAAAIHRRLPEVRVPGYRSLWPQTLKDDWERLYDALHGRMSLGPPMPSEVTYQEEVMEWLRLLNRQEQQLVWMRANRVPWKILVEEFGRSKPTLWRSLKQSLQIIAVTLNQFDPTGEHFSRLRQRAFLKSHLTP